MENIDELIKLLQERSAGYLYMEGVARKDLSRDWSGEGNPAIKDWNNLQNGRRGYANIDNALLDTLGTGSEAKAGIGYRAPGEINFLFKELIERKDGRAFSGFSLPYCAMLYSNAALVLDERLEPAKKRGLSRLFSKKDEVIYRKRDMRMSDLSEVDSDDKAYALIFGTDDSHCDNSGRGFQVSGVIVADSSTLQRMIEYVADNPEDFKKVIQGIFPEKGGKLLTHGFDELYLLRHDSREDTPEKRIQSYVRDTGSLHVRFGSTAHDTDKLF